MTRLSILLLLCSSLLFGEVTVGDANTKTMRVTGVSPGSQMYKIGAGLANTMGISFGAEDDPFNANYMAIRGTSSNTRLNARTTLELGYNNIIQMTMGYSGIEMNAGGPGFSGHTIFSNTTTAWQARLGSLLKITLEGNSSGSISGVLDGQIFYVLVCQDATGGHSYDFPSQFHGEGAEGTGANECSGQIFACFTTSDCCWCRG